MKEIVFPLRKLVVLKVFFITERLRRENCVMMYVKVSVLIDVGWNAYQRPGMVCLILLVMAPVTILTRIGTPGTSYHLVENTVFPSMTFTILVLTRMR